MDVIVPTALSVFQTSFPRAATCARNFSATSMTTTLTTNATATTHVNGRGKCASRRSIGDAPSNVTAIANTALTPTRVLQLRQDCSKTTPKAQAPAPDPHVPPQQSDQGLRFELTEKRAARLKRVAEALNDETKWGNVTANDRLRLGRVYDELVESLARKVVPKVQRVEHYVAVD